MFLSGDSMQHGVEADGHFATLHDFGEATTAGGATDGYIS